jgi:hypothetical protein
MFLYRLETFVLVICISGYLAPDCMEQRAILNLVPRAPKFKSSNAYRVLKKEYPFDVKRY